MIDKFVAMKNRAEQAEEEKKLLAIQSEQAKVHEENERLRKEKEQLEREKKLEKDNNALLNQKIQALTSKMETCQKEKQKLSVNKKATEEKIQKIAKKCPYNTIYFTKNGKYGGKKKTKTLCGTVLDSKNGEVAKCSTCQYVPNVSKSK